MHFMQFFFYADVTNQKGGKSKCPLLTETKGKINMTHEGEISYHLIEGTHIADVKTTEAMQQCMRDIAAGKVSVEEKLHEMQKIEKMISPSYLKTRKR